MPNKFLYNRNESGDDSQKIRDRKMFLTGGIYRESRLLAEMLRRAGIETEEIQPIREKKWDIYKFQMMTKSSRQANPHEIDACRIAFYYANKRKELTHGK